ncbi:MAG: hypothetical protein JOY61_02050, partial [Chloroflexi bacterium]|nr:hypothetical protein [Chloroflexota bacterium]
DGGVSLARIADAEAILPHHHYVTAEDARLAHDAGLFFATWSTSDPNELRNLVDAGVDAVATNHPDVLSGMLRSSQ